MDMEKVIILTILQCSLLFAAPLIQPQELRSSNGLLATTISVEQYFYQNSVTATGFWTRAYNPPSESGDVLNVGPTLYIRRGENVSVELINSLGPETVDNVKNMNSYHFANTTNLHTHGLHVSAESPQDNVFLKISPNESYSYTYSIPSDHAGGTFWYHAHYHGSTAIQVGGGLLGAIIVLDEEDDVPAAIWNLPEVVLIISEVEVDLMLTSMIAVTGDNLYESSDNYYPDVDGYSFTLVNGQYQPTITLTEGKWTRLRIIFSSLLDVLELQLRENNIGCEWYLLAKDGIYVYGSPRDLKNIIYLAPGNRADVVMRCASVGSFILGPAPSSDITQGTLIKGDVIASSEPPDEDLPRFDPYRPDYLADLYNHRSDNQFNFAFLPIPGPTIGSGTCNLNGMSWDGVTPLTSIETGSIQEWTLSHIDNHPFHLHVNSFQLRGAHDMTGYFQTGDWHDTIYLPGTVFVVSYMFAVDTYTTKSIIHCHFLPHEDLGCMGYANHTGPEATTGLLGHDMYCLGGSTGTAIYAPNCTLTSL